jgi:hypothetical protein
MPTAMGLLGSGGRRTVEYLFCAPKGPFSSEKKIQYTRPVLAYHLAFGRLLLCPKGMPSARGLTHGSHNKKGQVIATGGVRMSACEARFLLEWGTTWQSPDEFLAFISANKGHKGKLAFQTITVS